MNVKRIKTEKKKEGLYEENRGDLGWGSGVKNGWTTREWIKRPKFVVEEILRKKPIEDT